MKKKLTIIGGISLSTVVAFVIGIAVAVGTVIGIAFASEIFSVWSSAWYSKKLRWFNSGVLLLAPIRNLFVRCTPFYLRPFLRLCIRRRTNPLVGFWLVDLPQSWHLWRLGGWELWICGDLISIATRSLERRSGRSDGFLMSHVVEKGLHHCTATWTPDHENHFATARIMFPPIRNSIPPL